MARWHSCNVLQVGAQTCRVWQFDARNNSFPLSREQTLSAGEPFPSMLVGKSWSSLWQPRLNVAWLAPEDVFIRVVQVPESNPEETRAMVELQLEKLSPIPVTQAVWTMQVLTPSAREAEAVKMQTVVVTIVARNAVEEFLGKLEGQGFLADRLELPVLDQLQAMIIREDGAWVYPAGAGRNAALVAWWYRGVLRNLALIDFSPGPGRAASLKNQLTQMAWAGELEGWLTSPPVWRLVADGPTAEEWEPPLREGLEQPVETVAPLTAAELAALTARRATTADSKDNLLPSEFAVRYRQKFVDRLWMSGLLAALAVYLAGLVIYFIAVSFVSYQTRAAEKSVADGGPPYTNVLQLKARYSVLKERQELKYAALDCWEVTAELMPEGLTLDSLNFSEGKKLALIGTAPPQQSLAANEFSGKLGKTAVRGQPLFNPGGGDAFQWHVGQAGASANWSFGLELKRAEAP